MKQPWWARSWFWRLLNVVGLVALIFFLSRPAPEKTDDSAPNGREGVAE